MENERRTRVANFLRSLTSPSPSPHVRSPHPLSTFLRIFLFLSPLPPFSRYSRGYCRGACFASDYYLPRSESTAGLWYTGSMVSRYTPATTAPSPRPPRGTRAFPRCLPPGPADGLPRSPISRRRSCYRVVLSPLSYPANRALPPLSRRLHVLLARLQGRINCRFIGTSLFFIGLLGKPRCLVTTDCLHLERIGRPTLN